MTASIRVRNAQDCDFGGVRGCDAQDPLFGVLPGVLPHAVRGARDSGPARGHRVRCEAWAEDLPRNRSVLRWSRLFRGLDSP